MYTTGRLVQGSGLSFMEMIEMTHETSGLPASDTHCAPFILLTAVLRFHHQRSYKQDQGFVHANRSSLLQVIGCV
jgi:hypothetical protein